MGACFVGPHAAHGTVHTFLVAPSLSYALALCSRSHTRSRWRRLPHTAATHTASATLPHTLLLPHCRAAPLLPQVTNLAVSGTARVQLKPLLPEVPGFGAAVVSLMKVCSCAAVVCSGAVQCGVVLENCIRPPSRFPCAALPCPALPPGLYDFLYPPPLLLHTMQPPIVRFNLDFGKGLGGSYSAGAIKVGGGGSGGRMIG